MSIFSRIASLVKGQTHSILDELEKTKSASDQLVRELMEQLNSACLGYRDLIARRELLEGELSVMDDKVQTWENALVVSETKDKTLTEQCAANLRKAMAEQADLQAQLTEANSICADAEEDIAKMKRDVNALTAESQKLAAQYRMAQAQKEISGINLDSAKAQIARMQSTVKQAKAEVKANRLVDSAASEQSILEKLQSTQPESTADLLASVKAQRQA